MPEPIEEFVTRDINDILDNKQSLIENDIKFLRKKELENELIVDQLIQKLDQLKNEIVSLKNDNAQLRQKIMEIGLELRRK